MKNKRILTISLFLLLGLLVAACSGPGSASEAAGQQIGESPAGTPSQTSEPTQEPILKSEAPTTQDEDGGGQPQPIEPTIVLTLAPVIEPIQVTYFTPTQQEGPYYPVDKPADSDNDLVDFADATGLPVGQILEFSGKVYDAAGVPVEGIVVEIWQTDANGVYLHPNDPTTDQRDKNFQFYGEASTSVDGSYIFRTLLPGQYEPRPRHIHVKLRLEGQELLTTQFYFAGEIDLQGDDAAMLIATQLSQDADGNRILVGQRDIVLDVDLSNR